MIKRIETNDKKMSDAREVHYKEQPPATGHRMASRDTTSNYIQFGNWASELNE